MVEILVVVSAMSAAGLWLHGQVARYARDNPSLRNVRPVLDLCMVFWGVILLGKVFLVYRNGLSGDALSHEEAGRCVAAYLVDGRWSDAAALFGFGNRGYQFLLGVFYAITSAPPEIIVIINGVLGCTGLLGLLDALARNAACRWVPAWLAVCVCALPSAVYWTTTNLKEGMMLWAICGILRGGLLMDDRTVPAARRRLLFPALAGLWLRPHITAAWLVAVAVGLVVRRKKFILLPALAGGLAIAFWGISIARPEFVQASLEEGVSGAMVAQYQTSSDGYFLRAEMGGSGGGSAVSYAGSGPIPLLSGLAMVFLRPYPNEVFDLASAFAGAEVWLLSSAICWVWLRSRRRYRLLLAPTGIISLVGVLLIAFYLSYSYNLGLTARQRLQAFPGIFALIAMPTLSRGRSLSESAEVDAAAARRAPCRAPRCPMPLTRLPQTGVRATAPHRRPLPSRAATRGHPARATTYGLSSQERSSTDFD